MNIRAVQKRTGLTARAIRFYDENGLVRPQRAAHNRRVFDEACVERLELIALLRRGGMSIVDIRCVLSLRDHAPHGAQVATVALRSLYSEVQRLQEQLKGVQAVARKVRRHLLPRISWAAEQPAAPPP
jgi:DNA-binding transcriptional MerR regulator